MNSKSKQSKKRFGLDMTADPTLEAVAKEFDRTRERIRQIEARARNGNKGGQSDPKNGK